MRFTACPAASASMLRAALASACAWYPQQCRRTPGRSPAGTPGLGGRMPRTSDWFPLEPPAATLSRIDASCTQAGADARPARCRGWLGSGWPSDGHCDPAPRRCQLALAVMATTRKSSIPTQPWRLATSVVNLWVKSARRRACRARSLAISLMLRRSRFEYRPALCRFAQRSWRALRRSRLSRRRHSPAERVDDMRRGVDSSETNAEQATPKSTPHPGNPLATAGRSAVATPKLTCQPRASRDTVALRISPAEAGGTGEIGSSRSSGAAPAPT